MKIPVTEFKAKCTHILREVAEEYKTIEITNRGRIIAVVEPPKKKEVSKINPAWGALRGTVVYVSDDFDEPLGDKDWEASR
jgi:prevent-host-death family protein